MPLQLIKLRDSTFEANSFEVSKIQTNLIAAYSSQIYVQNSIFSDAINEKVLGLIFNLQESSATFLNVSFSDLFSSGGSAIYSY